MSATNPGVTPGKSGLLIRTSFLFFYSRSELKDANGGVTAKQGRIR